jgi:hypothetical protein
MAKNIYSTIIKVFGRLILQDFFFDLSLSVSLSLSVLLSDLRTKSRRPISAKEIYQRITQYRNGLGDFEQQVSFLTTSLLRLIDSRSGCW